MSEIKVNKITPRTACGTTTLGDSGDTFTVASGATIQNLGTATGFGGTGVVSWETSSIKTAGFTAVTGTGYFCDTTGGAFTVTLPLSPSAGDVVGVSDYAKTFDTDNLTLGRNGSNIGGGASDAIISTEGVAVTLVYVDATKGWIVTDSGNQSDAPLPAYVTATGGCITTCGNFKMHTFYSPGTLCVSAVGNSAGSETVDYMVVAGGGGSINGDFGGAGGGGAGGYRESPGTASGCYAVSPRGAAPAVALPVSATPYAITVGGGGASGPGADRGSSSIFSTITSTGGGSPPAPVPASPLRNFTGGSGGGGQSSGACCVTCGSAGNTPVTNPAQGSNGANGVWLGAGASSYYAGGGGGGAIACGSDGNSAPNPGGGGDGGIGAGTAINLTTMPAPSPTPSAQIGTPGPSPSVRYFSGGGGAGSGREPGGPAAIPAGAGGSGGGGTGGSAVPETAQAGTINTGGGGGGAGYGPAAGCGATGGSGIVVIRYKYQ